MLLRLTLVLPLLFNAAALAQSGAAVLNSPDGQAGDHLPGVPHRSCQLSCSPAQKRRFPQACLRFRIAKLFASNSPAAKT